MARVFVAVVVAAATPLAAAAAAAAPPIRIICMGDSITAGTASRARPPSWSDDGGGGYRANLYHALVASGVDNASFAFVGTQADGPDDVPEPQRHHEGYGGYDINHLMSVVPSWAPLSPNVVLLMAGTNSGNGVPECTINMSVLLRLMAAAAPQAQLLLATIIANAGEESYIDDCNAAFPAIAAQVPAVRLVNMHNESKICSTNVGPACNPGDPTHPTQGGYAAMAAVWWRALSVAGYFPAAAAAATLRGSAGAAAAAAALAVPDAAAATAAAALSSSSFLAPSRPLAPGRPAAGGPVRVMALGDSLTLGCGSTARRDEAGGYVAECTDAQGGFRAALYFALLGSGVNASAVQFVGSLTAGPAELPPAQRAHEGRPGLTVAQIAALASTWAANDPDVILLHAGTTDAQANGVNSSAAEFASNMTSLLGAIAARLPAAKVLVSTLILSRTDAGTEANIAAYNAALPAVVKAFSFATFVDMRVATDLCEEGAAAACCDDRTHPTMGGYSTMAAVWWRFLVDYFPTT